MKTLSDAINQELQANRSGGVFDASGTADSVIRALFEEDPERWPERREAILKETITAMVERRMARLIDTSDARQGWLNLPEYQRIPQLLKVEGGVVDVNDATLRQYRESEAELAARIKSYDYPRRSKAKLQRDKQRLSQMRKLDRRVAPLMAGEPEMKIRHAIELHQVSLETPTAVRNRKGGKARHLANRKSIT